MESCITPRATLWTGIAIGVANSAIASAGSDAIQECAKCMSLCYPGLIDEGTLAEDDDDVADLHKVVQSFCMVERHLVVVKTSTDYVTEAALASTDASMRGLQMGLQQVHTHCTRAVFSLDHGQRQMDQTKALETTYLNRAIRPHLPLWWLSPSCSS